MDPDQARDRPWVGVVGSGSTPLERPDAVEAVGAHLARRGAVLVTGGLAGTMEAVGRAYKGADGPLSVGILPGTDRAAANPHVDVPVVTGLGDARNALVAANADLVVAFPGGGGTMSEVGFARVHGKAILAVGAWEDLDGVEAVDDVGRGLEVLDGFLEGEMRGDPGISEE